MARPRIDRLPGRRCVGRPSRLVSRLSLLPRSSALPDVSRSPIPNDSSLTGRARPFDVWLSAFLLLAGAGMRAWQFVGSPSLWIDEILLARNILERPLLRLIAEPLGSRQVAPPGFLTLERLAVLAFGPSDWVLRLLPFVAALLALPLFWALTGRVLSGSARMTARALFAFSVPFTWYGSEVKQYSLDVMIALGLTLLALSLPERLDRTRWPLLPLLAGFGACWFSIPAALMLAGLGGALILQPLIEGRPSWRAPIGVVTVWMLGASLAAGYSLHTTSHETHQFMQQFWQKAFFPLPPWQAADLLWPIRQFESILGDGGLQYGWYLLALALTVAGLTGLVRTRRASGLALVGPIVAAILAAVVHVYPLAGRLVAFLMPTLVISLAEGMDRVATFAEARTGIPSILPRALLMAPLLGPVLLSPPVYRYEESEPVLSYLATHRGSGDLVYVYYGARPAVDFYGPRVRLEPAGLVWGGCDRKDPRVYLRELDQFRGRPRVWVLLSHDIDTERLLMLGYLSEIGTVSDSLVIPGNLPLRPEHGASVYLFDLSRPARLERMSADRYPVPGPSTRECGSVIREP